MGEVPQQFWTNVATGKKSMAGIGLSNDVVAMFNYIKTRASYKWVTMKLSDDGREVILEALGPLGSTFEDFAQRMPPNECR